VALAVNVVVFQACGKVVKYIEQQLAAINFGLDGKNVDATLTEFGCRFHRVVFEHLQQYQYNSMGTSASPCPPCESRRIGKVLML
jgi:hypothetical protein